MIELLLLLLGALGLGAYLWWRSHCEQRRREALFAFAVSRNWSYAFTESGLTDRWFGAPFGRGENRRVTSVIRGTHADRSLLAFDYAYDTTDTDAKGNRTSTTTYTSVVVVAMGAYLPRVEVVPETVMSRVGDAIGVGRDVELESDDFNRRFRVSAADRRFASDVLVPRTMELLVSRPPISFRFEGTDAVSWRSGRLDPGDLLHRVSTLNAVLDGVPRFVWRDHGAAG